MAMTTAAMHADINARDERGRTKIYLAAEAGDAAEVAQLLELKADFELSQSRVSLWRQITCEQRANDR